MVQNQIVARGVKDDRVLSAVEKIPRHLFVPEGVRTHAYDDRPLEIGEGQTISQPYMAAYMTQVLEVAPEDKVLEVGTGSGYQAAVLSVLSARVHTIERFPDLAQRAGHVLNRLACDNVCIHVGDGTLGYPEAAPYNAIIVTAGAPEVPEALKQQLAPGGRLVCPVGRRENQRLVRMRREGDTLVAEDLMGCLFVPLIGAHGWSE